jgi:UDP-GlcNAc:undecaprenyl-phosphate GlcNAc-1-phosphate transferase
MDIKYIALIIALLVSTVSMPLIILFSKKFNLYDTIDGRKVHTGQISRLGGLGITLAFSIALIILLVTGYFAEIKQNILFLVLAAICITAMGIIDDIVTLPAKIKLVPQIIASTLVLVGGFKFTTLSLGIYTINLGLLAFPLTFVWIIGVTNAVNLIDGIDGQCGGLSVIASATFCLFFFKEQNVPAMFICLSLICSVMGFLFFNLPLPKAKIFMGDGGSQTLGFILSVLPLLSSKGEISTVSILYAAAVLMIPIFDTIAAIWRRLREHRSIGSPDRFHLHHKLMMFGFSNRQALLIVCFFQIVICIFLCCSIWMGGILGTILLFSVYLMGILFFTVIHVAKVRTLEESNS